MKGSYAIHGRVVRSTPTDAGRGTISFELIFPEDWNLIERQLGRASQGFAQLHLDALHFDVLDEVDDALLCREVPNASMHITSIH